jgi:hypothetical protein
VLLRKQPWPSLCLRWARGLATVENFVFLKVGL